jgi:DNA segregation ATPase FtsK/SpoIIIE, S-DNA-T family
LLKRTAVKCLLETHRASTSHFQRWMGWGYNHAAHVIDLLTDRGIVAPPHGAGPRQILKSSAELKKLLKRKGKRK